jgi:hypothetical protein
MQKPQRLRSTVKSLSRTSMRSRLKPGFESPFSWLIFEQSGFPAIREGAASSREESDPTNNGFEPLRVVSKLAKSFLAAQGKDLRGSKGSRRTNQLGGEMVVHCVRCGKTEPLRKGRNGAPGSSLAIHEKMTNLIRKSFLQTCPTLCRPCLSDLLQLINSPEHRRMWERNLNIRRSG